MNNPLDPPGADDAKPAARIIGVFDSGVGGLSILRALHQRLPETSMLYVGDAAHAPYGEKSTQRVLERCAQIVEWLVAQNAALIVVACNTATVQAIGVLRARWPEVTFVGVEPGIKAAVTRSRTRRLAVMATSATAGSARLKHLIDSYAADAHVHVQPCPGLVDAIERGELQGAALLDVLMQHCDEVRDADVDTVVLGCTHYPFVEASIRELLGANVCLIDTASAVAERTASLWKQTFDAGPTMRVFSTGSTGTMRRLLVRCPGLEHVEVEVLTMIPSTLPG